MSLAEEQRKRRNLGLDKETNEYINAYMEEHKITYPGSAIERICKEHSELQKNQWTINYISEVVIEKLGTVLGEELRKIRLGSNNADKNGQIILELLNGLFLHFNIEDCVTTDMLESGAHKISRAAVEDRIAHQRQKKIDWQSNSST